MNLKQRWLIRNLYIFWYIPEARWLLIKQFVRQATYTFLVLVTFLPAVILSILWLLVNALRYPFFYVDVFGEWTNAKRNEEVDAFRKKISYEETLRRAHLEPRFGEPGRVLPQDS